MGSEAVQCSFTVVDERERWGRNVVAHHQCKRLTTDPSGRCFQHRGGADDDD